MADHTGIEWTDATWNPITGCSVVSPGCTNCYAMRDAGGGRVKKHPSRKGLTKQVNGKHVWTGEVRFNEQWLTQPLRWARPRRIFVCAHGDLFAEGVPDEWIDQIFAVMALCPQHTFQVLTKRPERMRQYLTAADRQHSIAAAGFTIRLSPSIDFLMQKPWPLPNVWLGVSVEDQRRADERRDMLACLAAEGWTTWVSYEPALGPIDWRSWEFLEWLVSGGESGRDARPSHPDWHRAARDFCAAYGIPYLFKQWGAWAEACPDVRESDGRHMEVDPDSAEGKALYDPKTDRLIALDGRLFTPDTLPPDTPARLIERLGKRRAGRLLDGVEHNAFPTSPQREDVN